VDHLSPSQVIAYVGSGLTPADRATCAAHLAACPACVAQVQSQQRLVDVLGDWSSPVGSDADVAAAVLTRLDASQTLQLRPWRLAAALRVAAAIVLGVGVGHFGSRWRAAPPTANPTPAPTLDVPSASDEPLDYALLADPDITGLESAYDALDQAEQGRTS